MSDKEDDEDDKVEKSQYRAAQEPSTENSTPAVISKDSVLIEFSDDNEPSDLSSEGEHLEIDLDSLLVDFSDGSELEKLHRCIKNLDISKPAEKLFTDPEEKISSEDSDEETFEDEMITQIIIIEKCDPVTPRISGSEGKLTSVIATSTHTFADSTTTTPQSIQNRPRPASFAGLSNRGARQLLDRLFHKGRSKSDGTATGSGSQPEKKQKKKTKKSQKTSNVKEEGMKTEAPGLQLPENSQDKKPMFEEPTNTNLSKLPPLKGLTKHKPSTHPTDDKSPTHPTEDEGVPVQRQESRWDQMGHAFRHAFPCVANQTTL